MGPLALLDFVGLDVSEAIGDALYADSSDPAHKPPGLMVEMAGEGSRVEGLTITRGGSAKSTSEPAARAAFELAAGRLEATGVRPPETAIDDPEGFLAMLDTEVRWQSP